MNKGKLPIILVLLGIFPSFSLAQAIPGIPGAAGAAAPAAAAPAAAAPKTLWSFLGISKAGCQQCMAKLCQSPCGQLMTNMMAPMRMFSGGLMCNCCPSPSPVDLANAAIPGAMSPAEAAAAKIKADEANAKARRAAVRYLGTVDCHVWPEAEEAIIAALRTDRNECVRLEAAVVLTNSCCCTKKTVAALLLVVTGSDKDGNPSETSERVKTAAMLALETCQSRVAPRPIDPSERKELPPEPRPLETPSAGIQQTNFLQRLGTPSTNPMPPGPSPENSSPPRMVPGQRNLYQIMLQASAGSGQMAPGRAVAQPTPAYSLAPLTPIGVVPPGELP